MLCTPRATGGGNTDGTAQHRAAILALWRSHCQAGVGGLSASGFLITKMFYFLWHVGNSEPERANARGLPGLLYTSPASCLNCPTPRSCRGRSAPYIPISRPSFTRVAPGMRSIPTSGRIAWLAASSSRAEGAAESNSASVRSASKAQGQRRPPPWLPRGVILPPPPLDPRASLAPEFVHQ